MKKKIVVIGTLALTCLLVGCVRVKVKNDNVVVEALSDETTEEAAVNTENVSTEQVTTIEITDSPEDAVSGYDDLPEDTDYFEDVFSYDVPDGYAVLDDDTKTNNTRMYVHSDRGKVVGSVYFNYPNTKEYNENEINSAYKKIIEKKYDVTVTGYLDTGKFKWDVYTGKLKDSKDLDKFGSVFMCVKNNTVIYLEFMHVQDYDDSAAIRKILNSFDYVSNKEVSEDEK